MHTLIQDIRYSFRILRKSPGFSAIAILTLALGIGANTAVFSLLNAVLLRSLPVRNPQQLLLFGKGRWTGSVNDLPNRSWQLFSYPFFLKFRQKNEVFSDVAAIDSILFGVHGRVAGAANLEKINAELVSGTYFSTLGVNAIVGRVLSAEDDQTPGAHPVAVASYSWWQRRLGRNPSAIGQTITIGPTVYNIIGVAPPEFFGAIVGQSPDVWVPLAMEKEISPGWNGLDDKLFQSLYILGRRKNGVGVKQASANTNLLFKQILHEYVGPNPNQKQLDNIQHAQIQLTSAATGLSQLRNQFSSPLKILMAVVAMVLLVACANVANLLLARAAARQREIALRMSLGADRRRLIRQLLVESALLALMGAVLGVWLAWWATQLLLIMVSTGSAAVPIHVTPDAFVLSFALVSSMMTVILFGIVPAFQATRLELTPALREGRGTIFSQSRSLLSRALIVAQVALSLVSLVGAGLFLRSLENLVNVDTGFNKQNVAQMGIDPGGAGYQPDARLGTVLQKVEQRVSALPGVQSASFALSVFSGGGWTDPVAVPGHSGPETEGDVAHNIVGSQYLQTMGMPIVLGRQLGPQDTATSRKVAIINETMARMYFGEASPLGRTFGIRGGPAAPGVTPQWHDIEVVGVVKDAKYMTLDEKQMPAAFYPHTQHPGIFLYNFIVRYTGDLKSIAPAIAGAVHQVDNNLPVDDINTLSQVIDDSVLDHRLLAQLCTFFGGLAAFLACIGIYGLMSYGVTQRTNEFGVRMALGARRQDVLWLVLRETLGLILMGVGVGLVAAPLASRLATSLLFGLKSYDPLTIASAMLAMIAVALFAGYFPARQATRVDPMVALRYE